MLHGEPLPTDTRVAKFREREQRLLRIYDPDRDHLGANALRRLTFMYARRVLCQGMFWVMLVAFYGAPVLLCILCAATLARLALLIARALL
jgi:hypothetical protein